MKDMEVLEQEMEELMLEEMIFQSLEDFQKFAHFLSSLFFFVCLFFSFF